MYEKEGKGMGDNSDQNQKKRQNRDFIIPDLRNETDRQYQYSKRPYQREYLSGTEWDREEKDTTTKKITIPNSRHQTVVETTGSWLEELLW